MNHKIIGKERQKGTGNTEKWTRIDFKTPKIDFSRFVS
ncbi:hypothetical protein GM3709_130 [Geminocystis sp. NIES-3709]|nr:hypothetical protein GM3709_130 [Geminocystis sp. NIES-3709]